MATEMIGYWDDLVSRPEFRGRQVKITVIEQPPGPPPSDDWLEGLRQMAANGVQVARPADDSREGIYGTSE